MKRTEINTKKILKKALTLAVPIMIQNAITNLVGMIDNVMVGRLGTEEMTGVAIVNQLMFVFYLALFGAVSGAGIFTAQFFGKGDTEGVKYAFRFKLLICTAICLVGILVFAFLQEPLINLYLQGESKDIDPAQTLQFGKDYIWIILIGLLPMAMEQAYSGTLRECGKTTPPMVAGIVAVVLNTALNYLLIFGKLGLPYMGVAGAAVATTISRFVQFFLVWGWTMKKRNFLPYMQKVLSGFTIPGKLVRQIIKKGAPLMLNEMLWAAGMAAMMQCYSGREIDVVSGMNIANTMNNIFNVSYIAFASGIAIVLGQYLGAGKLDEAKWAAPRLIAFSVIMCVFVGMLMALFAPIFPQAYKTTDSVKQMAGSFILIAACCMPICACMNACYFVLRSGGKTIITFLFDSCFVWAISIPLAYILVHNTLLPIALIYLICQLAETLKCVIEIVLVKRGVWISKMV